MAEFLALDWEAHQLCGLSADVVRGSVEVNSCFAFTWPDSIDRNSEPSVVGAWLKDQLKSQRVSAKQVLLTVPRDAAVIRQLELPQAPDEELPDLVRFQASTQSTLPLDQLLLDFLPLPQKGEGGRDVLLTTIPKENESQMRAVLDAAGLELVSLGVSSFSTAEIANRSQQQTGSNETALIVARDGLRVEISLLHGGALVFAHSARTNESGEAQIASILAEVSRSSITMGRVVPNLKIGRGWILGGSEEAALQTALAERLNCEVRVVDPLEALGVTLKTTDIPGNRALYAGPVGSLLLKSGGTVETVDVLNPRKPPVKRDERKIRAGIGAAAGLLLLASAFGYQKWVMGGLTSDIEGLQNEISTIDAKLTASETTLESSKLVVDWQTSQQDWLDQMDGLLNAMPGTDRVYFNDLRLNNRGTGGTGKVAGAGYARHEDDVEELGQSVAESEGYKLWPHAIKNTGDDPDYPEEFDLDVDLLPVEEKKSETTKTDSSVTDGDAETSTGRSS